MLAFILNAFDCTDDHCKNMLLVCISEELKVTIVLHHFSDQKQNCPTCSLLLVQEAFFVIHRLSLLISLVTCISLLISLVTCISLLTCMLSCLPTDSFTDLFRQHTTVEVAWGDKG